jgi:hypothetical protein
MIVASNRKKLRVLTLDHGKITTKQITKEEFDKSLKEKGLSTEFNKLIKDLQSQHVIGGGGVTTMVGGELITLGAIGSLALKAIATEAAIRTGLKSLLYSGFAMLNRDALTNIMKEKEILVESAKQMKNFPWANIILNLYGVGDPDVSDGFWTSVSARLYGGMTMSEVYGIATVFSDLAFGSLKSFVGYASEFYTYMSPA